MKLARLLLPIALAAAAPAAFAQQLDTRFSCSATRDENGERVIYADTAEMRIKGNRIDAFQWESSLFRSTHGFDCSIDESDGLKAEALGEGNDNAWRVSLVDARAARERRGFDFAASFSCTIRLRRNGDMLQIQPSCPALCGSRHNFSELSVDMKTGSCRYEK